MSQFDGVYFDPGENRFRLSFSLSLSRSIFVVFNKFLFCSGPPPKLAMDGSGKTTNECVPFNYHHSAEIRFRRPRQSVVQAELQRCCEGIGHARSDRSRLLEPVAVERVARLEQLFWQDHRTTMNRTTTRDCGY